MESTAAALRLRKIVLSAADFDRMPRSFSALAEVLAVASMVLDLKVHSIQPNGDQVLVYVHSESFDVQPCACRARELVVTLPGNN